MGYARFTATWLDDLYVVPAAQGRGVGTALLALVQALRPSGFGLWVFESNQPARGFYAKHGFVVTRRTDGRDNEERAPDLALAWPEPDPVSATRAAYDEGAAAYAAGLLDRTEEMLAALQDFVTAVGPAARVLEIGSGSGRDALALEGAGVRVARTDITPAFVRLLEEAGHPARVLDPLSDDLAAPDGRPWDGVWAQACLLHVRRADLVTVLARLAEAVRPDGALFCSVKEGDGERWSSHGHVEGARHFTFWREQPLRRALAEAGWRVERVHRAPGRTADEGWLAVLATRRPGIDRESPRSAPGGRVG